jgi:hypothetical protein
MKGQTMITKEELKSKINFSVDCDEILRILLSKGQKSANTAEESNVPFKEVNVDDKDFPCDYLTLNYVLMKFNMRNMLINFVKELEHKPPLDQLLYHISQSFITAKSRLVPPDYDLYVDALLTDIVSEEIQTEIKDEYNDIFELIKL